jgi:Ser/Thr protein kinase RdoA (MazF antagonist)
MPSGGRCCWIIWGKRMHLESVQTDAGALHAQLLPLLREVLGADVELLRFRIANQQHDYLVLLAQVGHPSSQVVIKLAGPEASIACPFERTAALHQLVATRTDILMPEVLGVDVSYRAWPWRYFIKRHIPGREWADVRPKMTAQQLSDAYREIGEAVAQLHSLHFLGFGELATDGTVERRDPYITALGERAGRFIKSARLRDLFLSVLHKNADLFLDVGEASLCHEDLHGHNILFRHQGGRWRLATVLDFDKAWAGHRESDLARLDFWQGMTSREFWSAYEAISPRGLLYRHRRPIYQLLWCLEYAQPTVRHLTDTKRLCAELGLQPVEHFG